MPDSGAESGGSAGLHTQKTSGPHSAANAVRDSACGAAQLCRQRCCSCRQRCPRALHTTGCAGRRQGTPSCARTTPHPPSSNGLPWCARRCPTVLHTRARRGPRQRAPGWAGQCTPRNQQQQLRCLRPVVRRQVGGEGAPSRTVGTPPLPPRALPLLLPLRGAAAAAASAADMMSASNSGTPGSEASVGAWVQRLPPASLPTPAAAASAAGDGCGSAKSASP